MSDQDENFHEISDRDILPLLSWGQEGPIPKSCLSFFHETAIIYFDFKTRNNDYKQQFELVNDSCSKY